MSILIPAAEKLRADYHSVTGVSSSLPSAPRPASPTERVRSLLHGESGELGYLFDNLFTVPASPAIPVNPKALPGPHGGTVDPISVVSSGAPSGHIIYPASGPTETIYAGGGESGASSGMGGFIASLRPGGFSPGGLTPGAPIQGPGGESPTGQPGPAGPSPGTTWRQRLLGR